MASQALFSLISPLPEPKKRTARERKAAKTERLRARETAKKEREFQKELERQKEKAKNSRPVTVLTAKHQPTYTVLSYKRLEGKENRKPPSAFSSKSEIQSVKSQTRLKNAINWMLLFADKKRVYSKEGRENKKTGKLQHNFYFKLAFITLTLSDRQQHSDQFIKEHMLQPFLYWLTRYYDACYVWKAESQLNGNIHFHITIDTYVNWKSIRSKWNKLLSKHGYCKVLQDGSNDKGDAATQIKSVLNDQKCANDIGGYMSKKDRIKEVIEKAFKEILAGATAPTKTITACTKWLQYGRAVDPSDVFQISKQAYDTASLHCKFDPEKQPAEQDSNWYKRVIEGRLWGCSEALSNVNVFIDETYHDFKKEEKIFFRQNDDIYNLGKNIIEREKLKHAKKDIRERELLRQTDEDIEKRYRFMENVFIHKHLSVMKKGGTLQSLLHDEKMKRKTNHQKFFTEN